MIAPEVAAIVVTYQTGPRLKECLHALKANLEIGEIIIVDNGNGPDMTAWLRAFSQSSQRIKYIETGENLGFGCAVNRGASQSEAAFFLVINPDCIMRHDALGPLMEAHVGMASPGIVGGRIFGLDGQNQRGPMRRELTLRGVLSKMVGGAGIDIPLTPQPAGPMPVDVISGAFFLIDRAGFETLGGFDTGYFLHVEDIDLCKRAHLAGGSVVYQPLAGALHFGATSDVSSLFVERHKAAGFARYLRKFSKGPAQRAACELVIPLIYLSLMGRALFKRRGGR